MKREVRDYVQNFLAWLADNASVHTISHLSAYYKHI